MVSGRPFSVLRLLNRAYGWETRRQLMPPTLQRCRLLLFGGRLNNIQPISQVLVSCCHFAAGTGAGREDRGVGDFPAASLARRTVCAAIFVSARPQCGLVRLAEWPPGLQSLSPSGVRLRLVSTP